MTEAPTFLKRRPVTPTTPAQVETGIRDILAKLKATADRDTFDVLADATNSYIKAKVRLTSEGTFRARDVDNLITVWQIMLDVGRTDPNEFAPTRSSGPNSGPKDEETEE